MKKNVEFVFKFQVSLFHRVRSAATQQRWWLGAEQATSHCLNHRWHSLLTHLCWGESTGDWWIPLTKSQWCRKCFHVLTSSWSAKYLPRVDGDTCLEHISRFPCHVKSYRSAFYEHPGYKGNTSGETCAKTTAQTPRLNTPPGYRNLFSNHLSTNIAISVDRTVLLTT